MVTKEKEVTSYIAEKGYNMNTDNQKTIFEKLYDKGLGVWLVGILITFALNRFLNYAWTYYAPLFVVGIYIIWVFVSIYSSKCTPTFKLENTELLCFQAIIPIVFSLLIACICVGMTADKNFDFMSNLLTWFTNNENLLLLTYVFTSIAIICNFIAYEKSIALKDNDNFSNESSEITETQHHKIDELLNTSRETLERLSNISQKAEDIHSTLERKSQVGYTATCIPIRYNKDHDTFVFALINNESHKEAQWMFPGSHVEVSNNLLREDFELTDINIVPDKIIEDKAKKEAGLQDLQFLDPYYDTISYEDTKSGKKERDYPNTCYPAKAPIFNYLFRVSKSAKCYEEKNHRCHYDFTYVGEYSKINEDDAEYEVIELEFNRNKNFKDMEYSEAVAYIKAKMGDNINKRLKAKTKPKARNQQNTPFEHLCLDSIPEMIYNAILFYSDYKKL